MSVGRSLRTPPSPRNAVFSTAPPNIPPSTEAILPDVAEPFSRTLTVDNNYCPPWGNAGPRRLRRLLAPPHVALLTVLAPLRQEFTFFSAIVMHHPPLNRRSFSCSSGLMCTLISLMVSGLRSSHDLNLDGDLFCPVVELGFCASRSLACNLCRFAPPSSTHLLEHISLRRPPCRLLYLVSQRDVLRLDVVRTSSRSGDSSGKQSIAPIRTCRADLGPQLVIQQGRASERCSQSAAVHWIG